MSTTSGAKWGGWLVMAGLSVLGGATPAVAGLGETNRDWMHDCFEEGRASFSAAVRDHLSKHAQATELTVEERRKLDQLSTLYPRLYGILINLYYLEEEPQFTALARDDGESARALFCSKLVGLSRFAAAQFIEALFVAGPNADWVRGLLEQFRDKDRVDLVLLSTGYFARLESPPVGAVPSRPLSSEYERQWALAAGRFDVAHELTRGQGIRVAVIDSGIDLAHPVYEGVSVGRPFGLVGRDGWPWADGSSQVDWGGHGTVVSSIVARFAPGAELTMYKCNDSDTMNNAPYPLLLGHFMAACIYKAVHDGNSVVNISAGIPLALPYLKDACDYARENNVLVVTGGPYSLAEYLGTAHAYPASFASTLAVTAVEEREGRVATWEAAGADPSVLIAAPNAPYAASTTFSGDEDRYVPGISCATPIVTAAAALVMSVYPRSGGEGPGEYVDAVTRILVETANSEVLGYDGFAPNVGYGLVDAGAAVLLAIERVRAGLPGPRSDRPGRR